MRLSFLCTLLAFSLFGCDGEASDDAGTDIDAGADPVTMAVLDVPAGTDGVDWGAAPYPHDVYLEADGTQNLASGPAGTPLWRATLEQLNGVRGFCRTCPTSFPIQGGDVDPSTLTSETVRIMREDGEGGFLDADAEYSSVDDAVHVRAAGLHVFAPATRYVVALTNGVMSADGEPLAASPQMIAARDGGDVPGADRVRAVIEPALVALEGAGVARTTVVAVAAFTTRDTGEHLRQIAEIVAAAPTPTATFERVFLASDGTLDDLLGTPVDERPGFDNTPMAGTEGESAIAHGNVAALVLGSFEAPRIAQNTGSMNGRLRRGADGTLEAGPQEAVPFALAIPVGADLTNLPIAIAHTGQPGSRVMAPYVANTLAADGIATISTSTYLNGERASTAIDMQHNFRGGDLGPDGFAEWDGGRTQAEFQGLSGSEDIGAHPDYANALSSQIVSDGIALVRFLEEGDFSAIAAADASLTDLAFDDGNTFWLGISYGAYTGMNVVAARGGIEAAVFNVGPGGLFDLICQGANRPQVMALLPLFGVPGEFDGQTRRLCHNGVLGLINTVFEETSPANAMHYLFNDGLHAGGAPHILFQYSDQDETIGQASAEIVLNAAGVPISGDVTYLFSEPNLGTPPFMGNVSTPSGEITAGAWMFTDADHIMLVRRQGISSFEAPFVHPFVPRATPRMFENPIDAVHAQVRAFFAGARDGATPTIEAPPP